MTRVMHVISGLGIGGAEAMLVQLAHSLKARGFEQDVVSVSDTGAHSMTLQSFGIEVHALNVRNYAGAAKGILSLANLIRRRRPDVVQGWMYHGDIFAALSNRLVPGSRRLYWNIRASDTSEGGYGWLIRLNARLSHWPDLVLANSKAGLDAHLSHGYRPRTFEVIHNGVDTDKFRPDPQERARLRAELGIAPDAVVVIHVARVNPMKDHDTFLAAMRAVPDLHALMVGLGTEMLDCPTNVRGLGVRHDVERLYRVADLVVSSSAFAEGFSNALAEGMSSGLVAVATDVGDARLIVGDAGSIVPIRDPQALARALRDESLRPDRDERKARARSRMVDHFKFTDAVDRFAKLYAV